VTVDLQSELSLDQGTAWVGFTGATGGGSENQDILNWSFDWGPSFGVGLPASAVSGTPFNMTVTALNSDGTVNTVYMGTMHFTSSDPQAALPADYTFASSDQGVHTFSVTLATLGQQSITATDTSDSSITGTAYLSVTTAPGFGASAAPLGPLVANNPFSGVVATFTDSDANSAASIDWGDGSTSTGTITTNGSGGYNVTGSHTFAQTGTVDVAVTITDSSGNSATVHAGPVAWWRGEGNTLDSTGNNPGAIQGTVTYAAGQVGQAFSFAGSGMISRPPPTACRPVTTTGP
jgi:hypothetical protein